MPNTITNPDDDNPENRERLWEEMGMLNPYQPCVLCGRETRNLYHCTPTCEDCEELIRKGD